MILFSLFDWEKSLSVSLMLIKMRSTINLFVPFACVAMGLLVIVSGCKKQSESDVVPTKEVIPSNAPESYMKDPDFMEKVESMERTFNSIVAELQPLVKRMKELSKGGSVRQENMAEYKDLQKRVVDLNAKLEKVRREQLAFAREKMTPPKNAASAKGLATVKGEASAKGESSAKNETAAKEISK